MQDVMEGLDASRRAGFAKMYAAHDALRAGLLIDCGCGSTIKAHVPRPDVSQGERVAWRVQYERQAVTTTTMAIADQVRRGDCPPETLRQVLTALLAPAIRVSGTGWPS